MEDDRPPADHHPDERPRTIVSAADGLPIRHDENESLSEDCRRDKTFKASVFVCSILALENEEVRGSLAEVGVAFSSLPSNRVTTC